MEQYAPVDEYEIGFFSSDQTNPYTNATHVMLNHQLADSRVTLEPLHQIARKRIRELVQKHTNQLFAPTQHPGILSANRIFEKFNQTLPTNFAHTGIDIASDGSGIEQFSLQLKHLCQQYKTVGEEVMRLEALLSQKTTLLDKLHERQNIVLNLKNNESLPGLLDAFGSYMAEIFKETNFETTYTELIQAHQQWNLLREILSVQQLVADKKDPMCAICLSEPVTHCVAPCGHTFCGGCVKRLTMSCYLCRGSVRERVKLFFT